MFERFSLSPKSQSANLTLYGTVCHMPAHFLWHSQQFLLDLSLLLLGITRVAPCTVSSSQHPRSGYWCNTARGISLFRVLSHTRLTPLQYTFLYSPLPNDNRRARRATGGSDGEAAICAVGGASCVPPSLEKVSVLESRL